MKKEIYYKTQDTPLFEVNGWKIAANNEKDVVGLAKRRGTDVKLEDVKFIGNVTSICGYADNYEDVVNWKDDKVKNANTNDTPYDLNKAIGFRKRGKNI